MCTPCGSKPTLYSILLLCFPHTASQTLKFFLQVIEFIYTSASLWNLTSVVLFCSKMFIRLTMHKSLFMRASDYSFVKSAISNSALPFLSFTPREMTDVFEAFLFFLNLKSIWTNGYSRNVLLHLWCVTQIKVNMFPQTVFDAEGIQFATH